MIVQERICAMGRVVEYIGLDKPGAKYWRVLRSERVFRPMHSAPDEIDQEYDEECLDRIQDGCRDCYTPDLARAD